ncbi:MAG: hypothetical protein CL916_12265 [Deltaproteobacteria bacterium]|nr:hypothetical protein [Deltaproteobacteria bacterium]
MNWIICANRRGTPYNFESSSIKVSIRAALGDFLQSLQEQDKEDSKRNLRLRNTKQMLPGLYLLLNDEGDFPQLVGFWIVFGSAYLEDGPKGAPDRDPPYAQEILEALTEEVWWKNYNVFPQQNKTWNPLIILHWPSSLAFRSAFSPPGLALSSTEFATGEEVDLAPHSWLERFDQEESVQEEEEEVVVEEEWTHVSPDRSLLMIIKGTMQHSRISHKGLFHMVHPQFLGDPSLRDPIPYPQWLDKIAVEHDQDPSTHEKHFLGQPLGLPNGHVALPASGWLTNTLDTWPIAPKDIRHAKLMARDVGSRAIAQLRQAIGISLGVLCVIVTLSLVVRVATTPQIKQIPEAVPPQPQPALSLCSPDYDLFMEELRCQISHFAVGTKSNRFCRDKGTEEVIRDEYVSELMTDQNLQAVYCGLRDREDDGRIYKDITTQISDNFATIALTKACFNVLGHPYEYAKRSQQGDGGVHPDPRLFLTGNLSVQQLIDVHDTLDVVCDSLKERTESRIEGAIFSSFIGAKKPKDFDSQRLEQKDEGYLLREDLSKIANASLETGVSKNCFALGMTAEPYGVEDYDIMCERNGRNRTKFQQDETIWNLLNQDQEHTNCIPSNKTTSRNLANTPLSRRDLQSCSIVAQYETARFGDYPEKIRYERNTPKLHTKMSEPSSLWQCHNMLGYRQRLETKDISVLWDLSLPVPQNYNINGVGVQRQIQLDAGLRALQIDPTVSGRLGACWDVVSSRLQKYQPVHPLLTEPDENMWVTSEQQVCAQVCASYYRFKKPNPEKRKTWLTRKNDLRRCIHDGEPKKAPYGNGVLDKLLLPWNNDINQDWILAKDEHVCAFNLIAQGYFPDEMLVGEIAPPVWAGTTNEISKVAGGTEGAAYKAIESLRRYGQTRSRASCAYASTQCFSGLITEALGESEISSEWKQIFEKKVLTLSRLSIEDLDRDMSKRFKSESLEEYESRFHEDIRNPWCRMVHPYLDLDGLPEGQLDLPCAIGVDDAQKSALASLATLLKDYEESK